MENCRNKKGPRFPSPAPSGALTCRGAPGARAAMPAARRCRAGPRGAPGLWPGQLPPRHARPCHPPRGVTGRRARGRKKVLREGPHPRGLVTARRHRSSVSLLTSAVPYGAVTCAVPCVCACVSVRERVWRTVFRASRSLGHPPGLLERGVSCAPEAPVCPPPSPKPLQHHEDPSLHLPQRPSGTSAARF